MSLAQNAVEHTARRRPDRARLARSRPARRGSGCATRARASPPPTGAHLRALRARREPRGAPRAPASGWRSCARSRTRTAAGSSCAAQPGEGSRFTLSCRSPPRLRPAGGRRAMSRILIAEDEQRLASFLEKGLRAAGFVTTSGRRRARRAGAGRDRASSTCWCSTSGCPGWTGSRCCARCARASGGCR